jgi:hypothetical protein
VKLKGKSSKGKAQREKLKGKSSKGKVQREKLKGLRLAARSSNDWSFALSFVGGKNGRRLPAGQAGYST